MNNDVIAQEVLLPSLQTYADKISGSWRKAAESILETGRHLCEAEDTLAPSDYRVLITHLNENCGISSSVISKLKGIARNRVLTAPENLPSLPASYATLYRMTAVDDDQLAQAFSNHEISCETQLKDVEELFPKTRKHAPSQTNGARLSVNFRGDLSILPKDEVNALTSALDALQVHVVISRSGI